MIGCWLGLNQWWVLLRCGFDFDWVLARMEFFNGGFCFGGGCWLLTLVLVLGTWVRLWVLSLVLDWTNSDDGVFQWWVLRIQL